MKVGLYTNAVLTVIAVCLIFLCWTSRPPVAHAAGQPGCGLMGQPPCNPTMNVVITGWRLPGYSNGLPVSIVGPVSINADKPVPVGIAKTGATFNPQGSIVGFTNDPVPVQIKP